MKLNLIKSTILTITIATGINMFVIIPALAASNVCETLDPGTPVYEANGCDNSSDNLLPVVIKNILFAIIGVTGLVAVIYIIIGGAQYMTSAGDSTKITKAKNTILYAVIGLFVCVLAFAIVNFVINIIENS